MTNHAETKPIAEGFIVKASLGILITMSIGLVAGTTYISKLSSASELHAAEIKDLKARLTVEERFATDIAVIKNRIDSIDKKLDN